MRYLGLASIVLLILAAPPGFAQIGVFDNTADWYSPENPRGNIKVAGNVTVTDGLYTVEGNGDDIWNNDDEGFFVYSEKSGSWRLSARVNWFDPGTNDWAKAGVMIRENATLPQSRHYWIELRGAGFGDRVDVQWRTTEGGGSGGSQVFEDPPDNAIPVQATNEGIWLRVTRIAPINMLISEWSFDGTNWTQAHSTTVEGWGDTVAYGLAVTNHDDNDFLATAEFDNVVLEEVPPVLNITRSFSKRSFVPAETLSVTLNMLYTGDTAADSTITEEIPAGFTASNISDGGTFSNGTITWNISVPPGNTQLTYNVTANADYDPAALGYGAQWSGSGGTFPTAGPDTAFLFQVAVGDELFKFDFENPNQFDEWEMLAGFWDIFEGRYIEFDDAGGPLVTVTGDPGLTDVSITVEAQGLVGDADWGIAFRVTDIGNHYSWQFVNGGLDLILYNGGARSTLYHEDYPEVLNVWQKFQVIVLGNVIHLLFNDEIKAVIQDDTHAAGQVGLFGWVNSGSDVGDTGGIVFDNFVVSEAVVAEEPTKVEFWSYY